MSYAMYKRLSTKVVIIIVRIAHWHPEMVLTQKWSSLGYQATGDKTDQVWTLPDHGHFWDTTHFFLEGYTMYIMKTAYQKCPPSPSTSPIFFHSPRIRGHSAIPW